MGKVEELKLHNFTRREFIKGMGATGLTLGIIPTLPRIELPPQPPPTPKEQKEVVFTSSVLYYHEIIRAKFQSDIISLIKRGYQPLSLDEFVGILNNDEGVPRDPTFMITCDDGLYSQYSLGIPSLDYIQKETGILVPLTLFSIMQFNGMDATPMEDLPDDTPSFFDGSHRYMNKAQLVEMIQRGNYVGNHTKDHKKLPRLPVSERNYQVEAGEKRVVEIWDIAGVSRKYKGFAYPFGEFAGQKGYMEGLYDVSFTTQDRTKQDSVEREQLGRHRMSLNISNLSA